MAPHQTAVVSGVTGFLGGHLCRLLVETGWNVIGLVRSSTAELPAHVERQQIAPDFAHLVNSVHEHRPDVVFHVASHGGASHRPNEIPAILDANVTLGSGLLEACRGTETRFVGVGSFWQHARPGGGTHPNSFYAASKQALEEIARYYREVEEVRAVIVKPYDIYGPHDPRPKFLQLLAQASVDGTELSATAGEQIVSFVHVRDVARALAHAAQLLADTDVKLSYGVAGPEHGSLRHTIESVIETLSLDLRVAWGARDYRPNEVMQPTILESLPGWEPSIVLAEGFMELIDDASRAN